MAAIGVIQISLKSIGVIGISVGIGISVRIAITVAVTIRITIGVRIKIIVCYVSIRRRTA